MNGNIRERIARAKRKLTQRLARAIKVNEGGAVTAGKPVYELSDKARANPWAGIGVIHRLVLKLRLPARVNESLHLLKVHVPYHESDHVLNIAYNALCGGRTLDDIEHRRHVSRTRTRSAPRAFRIRQQRFAAMES